MRSMTLRAALAALAVALVAATPARGQTPRANQGGKVRWERDAARALAEAARTGRPAILYFTHDG